MATNPKPPTGTMSNLVAMKPARRPRYTGKYPPDAFLIPGQDQNGNSARLDCRVIPQLKRDIAKILVERKFPFRTEGDLMRWAILEGVKRLLEMEPVEGSVIAQADAIITVLQAEAENFVFGTVFQNLGMVIADLLRIQAIGQARKIISDVKANIEDMESEFWRERYGRELEDKYGYLLKSELSGGAGLLEFAHRPGEKVDVDTDDGDGE